MLQQAVMQLHLYGCVTCKFPPTARKLHSVIKETSIKYPPTEELPPNSLHKPHTSAAPIWSPDSKQIAFASDRNGNFDLFVMSADGGAARRLTTHSASEIPSTFTTDGNYILFSASIQDPANSALFPTSAMTELYKVPVTGGRTEQVLGTPAEMVCFDKSGKTFLYQDRKGFEDEWRKHHTSSITRDVWYMIRKTASIPT